MLHPNFHNGYIGKSAESIKRSFSILALLKTTPEQLEEDTRYINARENAEVEILLDQPSEKRAVVKKEVFLKGKQETLDDVITFIANIFVFARYWTKMDEDSSTHPLVLQMINEIADFISASEFRTFYDAHKHSANWIPHTLIAYIFNIFSIFVKAAKNPTVIRKYKVKNIISYDDFNMSSLMISSLIDQLRLCTATGSLQVLFASPTSSFKVFCPNLIAIETSKRPRENDKTPESKFPKREASKGSMKNTSGKRL